MVSLINQIKPKRQILNLTQAQLADMASIPRPHLCIIERGKLPGVRMTTIDRIFQALEREERKQTRRINRQRRGDA